MSCSVGVFDLWRREASKSSQLFPSALWYRSRRNIVISSWWFEDKKGEGKGKEPCCVPFESWPVGQHWPHKWETTSENINLPALFSLPEHTNRFGNPFFPYSSNILDSFSRLAVLSTHSFYQTVFAVYLPHILTFNSMTTRAFWGSWPGLGGSLEHSETMKFGRYVRLLNLIYCEPWWTCDVIWRHKAGIVDPSKCIAQIFCRY